MLDSQREEMHKIQSQDYALKIKDLEAKVDQWKQEELSEVKDQVDKLVKKLEERDRAARELIQVNQAKKDKYKRRCFELEKKLNEVRAKSPRFGEVNEYHMRMLSLDKEEEN